MTYFVSFLTACIICVIENFYTMNVQEKKFFSVKIKPITLDINRRWFLECIEMVNPYRKKRTVIYGHINRGKTVDERLRIANELIDTLQKVGAVEKKEKSILQQTLNVASLQMRFKTISAYQTVITYYLEFLNNRSDLHANTKTINEFLLWLQSRKISNNTIAKYRNTLFTLYNKAIDLELTKHNPVQKVKAMKRSPKSLMYFSDAQMQQLKAAILKDNQQLWLGVQLLFYCFIRPTEQRGLKIMDINLDYDFIEIPAEISKNKKTQKVVIPAIFKKDLEFIRNYPKSFYVLGKNGTCGREPIGIKWLNDQHSRYLKQLQITGRFAFYSWKHTGVVKCVQSGLNIRDIQNQLRHHSLDMVQEYLKNLGVLQSIDLKNKYPAL